jgi:hypothetical protein
MAKSQNDKLTLAKSSYLLAEKVWATGLPSKSLSTISVGPKKLWDINCIFYPEKQNKQATIK